MTFSMRSRMWLLILVALILPPRCQAVPREEDDVGYQGDSIFVGTHREDGTYGISPRIRSPFVLWARVGAKVNGRWLFSTDYPKHDISTSSFQDVLGSGKQFTISSIGSADRPDLICVLQIYDKLPFATVLVAVHNSTSATLRVEAIRVLDAVGTPTLNMEQPESAIRVLSDSFSEDQPILAIYDLAKPPEWGHLGVGSQLIVNRQSGESLFFGALTSDRFLTVLRLGVRKTADTVEAASYTIDSTGTTEIQKQESLRGAPAEDQVELSLPLPAGGDLSAERVMFAAGSDYHAELEAYGDAIRRLHHARVGGENLIGWWSWTAFYGGITEGEAVTNARWLAGHLKSLGYDYFHIDEGYQYARGEYITPNAAQFPHGMLWLGHLVSRLGLKLGIWTAPFEVSSRAWVYEHHKDWLVKNAAGKPIPVGGVGNTGETVYALDSTHPGAQEYLRKTYHTLTREWGVCYIKLDFMDASAIEGYHYRPNTSALEAQRLGLEIIRQAVGDGVLLDKDGSPMLNPVGIVDEGRVSVDTGHLFGASKEAAPGIAARYYMHRNFFVNDPDAFTIARQILPDQSWHQKKGGLTLDEARVSIALAAVSGGMFEDGDDLPTAAADPDRLDLLKNPDLLQVARLGRAGLPLDLMTFRAEDAQPSVFFLREDPRLAILTVFNWTDEPRSHTFTLAGLKFPEGDEIQAFDVFDPGNTVALEGGEVRLDNQPAHSVRMIKLVDARVPAAAPSVTAEVPSTAATGAAIKLSASADASSVPALGFHWAFGDGTDAEGAQVTHTYTRAGTFNLQLRADGVDGVPYEKSFTVSVSGPLRTRFTLRQNRRFEDPNAP